MTAANQPCAADCTKLVGPKGAKGLCAAHYQQVQRGTLTIEAPLPRFAPPPAEPLCVGEHQLFDSKDPDDHALAKAICAECPALRWCAERAADLRRDHSWCQPLTGTWAGRLYGKAPGEGRRILPKREEPNLTDVELRACHAAFQRGERDDATVIGERIYNRKRKARKRLQLAGVA